MAVRLLIWGGLALVALALAGFGAWIMRLPATPASGLAQPVAQDEMDAMLTALRPPKRARPLVAIIGINDATDTTDYLMPTGILRRADIADVVMLATQPGPVRLYPALTVEPDATIADFDARHPEGADYVIVPAMSRDDDPAVLAWNSEPGGQGRNHHRHLHWRESRCSREASGRQAGDHALVRSARDAPAESCDRLCPEPAHGCG